MSIRIGRVPAVVVPIGLAVLLVLAPWLGLGIYWNQEIVLTVALALMVSGLNLSLGYAGELALGQVFIYAVGAYVSGNVAVHLSADLFLSLLFAVAAALVIGVVSGIPGLRLGGWALAMTSFFLVLLIPDLVNIFQSSTGGTIGLVGIPPLTLFGHALDANQYYAFAVVAGCLWFAVFRNLVVSRHGPALLVLRQSPVLAESLGIPVRRLKLKAYALGAVPCGIAGVLFGNLNHFITPSSPGPFTITTTFAVLAASVLGGPTSVYGAAAGAAIIQLGPLRLTSFQQYSDAVDGAFLILFGVLLSGGLSGICTTLLDRLRARREKAGAVESADLSRTPLTAALSGATLEVDDVHKRFGGNTALAGVSLRAAPGRITALIGPNGSGKTTLLNVICGFYSLDRGSIRVDGAPINGRRPHQVARSGVLRTFQTPLIPKGLTVAETVATACYATAYSAMPVAILRLPAHWRGVRNDARAVEEALAVTGISHLAHEDAESQPLGIRRLIEVARVVAANPKVVLFDEIASGLDDDEVEDLSALMRELAAAGATVVLVEHNFGLVLEVADEIYVLANGAVVASGPPAEIAAHPAVLREYLGISEEALDPVLGETGAGSET
jgi:branched-chain amino acid transport system permease protein